MKIQINVWTIEVIKELEEKFNNYRDNGKDGFMDYGTGFINTEVSTNVINI